MRNRNIKINIFHLIISPNSLTANSFTDNVMCMHQRWRSKELQYDMGQKSTPQLRFFLHPHLLFFVELRRRGNNYMFCNWGRLIKRQKEFLSLVISLEYQGFAFIFYGNGMTITTPKIFVFVDVKCVIKKFSGCKDYRLCLFSKIQG